MRCALVSFPLQLHEAQRPSSALHRRPVSCLGVAPLPAYAQRPPRRVQVHKQAESLPPPDDPILGAARHGSDQNIGSGDFF